MYKVRNFAHDTARSHRFNPFVADAEKDAQQEEVAPPPNDEEQQQNDDSTPKDNVKKPLLRQIIDNLRIIFLRSWLNVLLVFVPAGIAVYAAGVDQNVVFALNAIAVVPLAGLLTFATESISSRTTPTIAALMNVSFGNSVELIIFIIALIENQIRIVQASLVGSILANLLLILGMSMTFGGLRYQEQIYDSVITQTSSSLLVLSVLSLLVPTVFHASFSDQVAADAAVIKLSRGTAIILLVIYILYLIFQLKSHAYLYEGTPQHVIDEQTQPGILQRLDSSSSSDSDSSSSNSSITSSSTGRSGSFKRTKRITRRAKAKFRRRLSSKAADDVAIAEEEEEGQIPTSSSTETPAHKKPDRTPAHPPQTATAPATSTAVSVETTNNGNNNTMLGRRPAPLRGLTIRAPPVFRADSQLNQPSTTRIPQPTNQLRRYNSTPNMPSAAAAQRTAVFAGPAHTASGLSGSIGAPLATTTSQKPEPEIGLTTAIILLLGSTALVATCAEFLVSSIEHLVESSPLSEAFIGLIILPIVGNAAEHVTAVVVAAKNQMDLALSVALGSSIQIALFITPLVVLIGWMADKGMSLYFTLFETVTLFASVFIVCFLCLDGRSNYLEGVLLCGGYLVIALSSYWLPDGPESNAFANGTAGGS